MGTSAFPKIRFFEPQDNQTGPKAQPKPPKPPKIPYRLTNWAAYNQALIQRGRIELWLDEQTLQNWYYTGPRRPGGICRYSDACIEAVLQIKYVLGLAFRQTQGFIASLFDAVKLDLQTPSYSQLCRRQHQLSQSLSPAPAAIPQQEAVYVVVDSTGLKVYGEGEWKVRQHGSSQRRTWRKVHVAYDEATNEILAIRLTTNDIDDASVVAGLLDGVAVSISQVGADGAYDRAKVYTYLAQRGIKAVIAPRMNAVIWTDEAGQALVHARNEALLSIDLLGRSVWKEQTGYHRRSKAETGMYRLKTIFGDRLRSRTLESQRVEVRLKATCLNQFRELGMPKAVKKVST